MAKLLQVDEEQVTIRKGIFRYHKSYFWGLNNSADKLVDRVREKVKGAVILASGNNFSAFNSRAKSGTAKDSHLWVKFTIPQDFVLPENN